MSVDVANLSSSLGLGNASTDVGLATLKKAMDTSQTMVAELLQSIPAPQPAHLGQNVNTLA